MDLNKFFERIGFEDKPKANMETLSALQSLFLLSVPFENLDMHYGNKPITLDLERVYDKIVERKRGGICYECSLLMSWALQEIGFSVNYMSAQMMPSILGEKLNDRHMFLRVLLDGQNFAVDVGNGQSFRHPLCEEGRGEDVIPEGKRFRMGLFDNKEHPYGVLRALFYVGESAEDCEPRFVFEDEPRLLEYFEYVCNFAQTSPQSIFVKKPLASLALPDGRISVTPSVMRYTRMGVVTEVPFRSEKEFLACLKERFNLVVEGPRYSPFGSETWQAPEGFW